MRLLGSIFSQKNTICRLFSLYEGGSSTVGSIRAMFRQLGSKPLMDGG